MFLSSSAVERLSTNGVVWVFFPQVGEHNKGGIIFEDKMTAGVPGMLYKARYIRTHFYVE